MQSRTFGHIAKHLTMRERIALFCAATDIDHAAVGFLFALCRKLVSGFELPLGVAACGSIRGILREPFLCQHEGIFGRLAVAADQLGVKDVDSRAFEMAQRLAAYVIGVGHTHQMVRAFALAVPDPEQVRDFHVQDVGAGLDCCGHGYTNGSKRTVVVVLVLVNRVSQSSGMASGNSQRDDRRLLRDFSLWKSRYICNRRLA